MKIEDIAKQLRGFYDTQVKSLNGIMERLPEALRPELKKLRDDVNEQLSKLPPLEQVPASLDMAYALNSLNNLVERIVAYSSGLNEQIKVLADKAVALQSLEDRVSKKELLTKEEATTLVTAGRTEERTKVEGEFLPRVMSYRKNLVEVASLPVPGEDILKLTEEDFTKRFDVAKKIGDESKKRGFTMKGNQLIERCAWMPTEADALKELDSIEAVVRPGGKGATGHPLKGERETAPATENNKPRRRVLC